MTVVVAGEALVDLTPEDGGALRPLLGGSPYNVAVGLGRLEAETHYLGVLSTDAFGQQLAGRLEQDDVWLDLGARSDAPTTLAVVHLDDEGRASYGFYLDGTSAGTFGDVEPPPLPSDAALHVSLGAVTFATDPAGHATRALLERERGRRVTPPRDDESRS
jgi:fructokinase